MLSAAVRGQRPIFLRRRGRHSHVLVTEHCFFFREVPVGGYASPCTPVSSAKYYRGAIHVELIMTPATPSPRKPATHKRSSSGSYSVVRTVEQSAVSHVDA